MTPARRWLNTVVRHDIVLEGFGLRLEPLADRHGAALLALIDDELWAGMPSPPPRNAADIAAYVAEAEANPTRLAFAVVVPAGEQPGQVRGSTSFYGWVPEQGRVEIGHTFYGRPWWGGRTNPTCKYLLLTHAFEVLGAQRVALRADARNARSLAAMRKLGAVPEGVLRSHRVAADGSRGDTAYFSILAPEWPAVRAGLLARLGVGGSARLERSDGPTGI